LKFKFLTPISKRLQI